MNNRKPDTQLAEAIRNLQKEIDDKATILKALRAQYVPEEVDYYEYIKTEAWEEMRQKVFRRDGFQCVICKEAKNLNVHHITYERLGCEELADLVTLCQKCHKAVHNGNPTIKHIDNIEETLRNRNEKELYMFFGYQECELLQTAYEMGKDYLNEKPINPDYFQHFEAREIVNKFNKDNSLPAWVKYRFDKSPMFKGDELQYKGAMTDYYKVLWCQVKDNALSYQIQHALYDLSFVNDEYKEEALNILRNLEEQRESNSKEAEAVLT